MNKKKLRNKEEEEAINLNQKNPSNKSSLESTKEQLINSISDKLNVKEKTDSLLLSKK